MGGKHNKYQNNNKSDQPMYFLLMKWHQVAFILAFTSQFTVLVNYLCALDTTLRILNTCYRLHFNALHWYHIIMHAQARIDLPRQSHPTQKASALPPSHHSCQMYAGESIEGLQVTTVQHLWVRVKLAHTQVHWHVHKEVIEHPSDALHFSQKYNFYAKEVHGLKISSIILHRAFLFQLCYLDFCSERQLQLLQV